MKVYVFVYGTLKSGFRNDHIMKRIPATFVINAKSRVELPMFDIGHGFPYLQSNMGIGKIIKGEIYEVKLKDMPKLDFFEGVPELYKPVYIDYTGEDGRLYPSVRTYCITDELGDQELEKVEFLEEYLG